MQRLKKRISPTSQKDTDEEGLRKSVAKYKDENIGKYKKGAITHFTKFLTITALILIGLVFYGSFGALVNFVA